MIKLALILVCFVILNSCSIFSPVKGPDHTYMITSVACPKTYGRSHLTLFVAPITSNDIFNTSQMAYTIKPYQISYFAKNAWAEPPAEMLQPLLVQTLQNTHFFRAVTTLPAQSDYVLNVQLLELRQNFLCQPSRIELKLRAQIINSVTNEIVGTQLFCVVRAAPCCNPYGGVIAANEATAEALAEIATFTVRTLFARRI